MYLETLIHDHIEYIRTLHDEITQAETDGDFMACHTLAEELKTIEDDLEGLEICFYESQELS